MPTKEAILPDRLEPMKTDLVHYVSQKPLAGPFPKGFEMAMFGMGCFWESERVFWGVPGVWVTAVGYSGGYTAHPRYEDIKSGRTGHAEVVRIVFDPKRVSYEDLLKEFWEGHDPTAGMRQGVDEGIQYRSAIYYFDEGQRELAERSRERYQTELSQNDFGKITTEIESADNFYFAESEHQAYAAKHDHRCDVKGTGVGCPIGLGSKHKT